MEVVVVVVKFEFQLRRVPPPPMGNLLKCKYTIYWSPLHVFTTVRHFYRIN